LVHEIKHDGYRIIVCREGAAVRLYSRNAYDWTLRLAAMAAAAELIKAKSFTIDGEAVVLGSGGLSRFEELSRREAARTAIPYAFDLIEHDGEDLRDRPFLERKAALARLLRDAKVGRGRPCSPMRAGYIVAKKADGTYRSSLMHCAAPTAATATTASATLRSQPSKTIHSPYAFPFSLANEITSYPGYNYGGEEPAGRHGRVYDRSESPPFRYCRPLSRGSVGVWAPVFCAISLVAIPTRKFRAEDFRTRIEHISALMDSTDPDLSRYAARGGTLILKENMSDYAISPFNGIAYYNSVVEKLGQTSVDSFMRFYVTTGANHFGAGVSSVDGTALPQGVDLFEAIDGWVDRSTVAQDSKPPFAVTASRPLCRYPQWQRYMGSPPDDAASFSCVTDSD
jgi:hypothetical protein